jgi:integrase
LRRNVLMLKAKSWPVEETLVNISTCPPCARSNGMKSNPLPLNEYHKLLDILQMKGMEREHFLVHVLGQTGLRVSEFIELRAANLSLEGPEKKILVRTLHARDKWVGWHKISGETAGVIERWIKKHGIVLSTPVFSYKDKNGMHKPYTKRAAQAMFKKALKVAGLSESYSIKSLRQMYAITVARATGDVKMVTQALRDRDPRSAMEYVIMAEEFYA